MNTPAGTPIVARSLAPYAIGSDLFTATSNAVVTTVAAAYAVALAPLGTVATPAFWLQGTAGDTLYATFTLTNLGNAPDSMTVTPSMVPPGTIALDRVVGFLDLNANGRLDAGEDNATVVPLDAGEATPLVVAFMLPSGQGAGETYCEILVASAADPGASPQRSVVRVTTLAVAAGNVQLGPYRNPQALPGGEGSQDDVTARVPGFGDAAIVFRNDVTNIGASAADVVIAVADTTGWPAGFSVTLQDTAGAPLPVSPIQSNAFALRSLAPSESRSVLTVVSTGGTPFYQLMTDSLQLRLAARLAADTSQVNLTTDVILRPQAPAAAALLSLEQTFRENRAGFGDVVTLVVSVSNLSESVAVDSVTVSEFAQPALDFLSSPEFVFTPDGLRWSPGSLAPGEKRQTAIKFVLNSRTGRGTTKVVGEAAGRPQAGQPFATPPVVNVLQVENDVFADQGLVFGEVFVDSDGNGVRGPADEGVPGAAIYLESGEFALTDSLGKYSIPEAFSGYRVVRLDENSLPRGTTLASGQPAQHIVHLLAGGHARVSFAVLRPAAPPSAPPPAAPPDVARAVVCRQSTELRQRSRVLYQIPSVPSSYFEPGTANLWTEKLTLLRPIPAFLAQHPDWVVLLEGHADSVPIHTAAFPSNQELSEARAAAVAAFLAVCGVPRDQMVVRGHGDREPIADNATAEGRSRNRRVEVGFLPRSMLDDVATSLRRVQSQLSEIVQVPDTFQVRAVWELATDAHSERDLKASLTIPGSIADVTLSGRSGDEALAVAGDSVLLQRFSRSRPLTVELSGQVAGKDTATVRQLQLALEFASALRDSVAFGAAVGPSIARIGPRPTGALATASADADTLVVFHEPAQAGRDEMTTGVDGPSNQTATGALPASRPQPAPQPAADTAAESVALGIVEPLEAAVFSSVDRIRIRVRVPLGCETRLWCNGERVAQDRLGEKVVGVADRIEEATYYGVKILPGWNTLVLDAQPVAGEAVRDTLRVAFAGRPQSLEPVVRRVLLPADGTTTASLRFAVRDGLGLAVVDGIIGTVTSGDSLVLGMDARPGLRGYQVAAQDGTFQLQVRASRTTGTRVLTLECEGMTGSCEVTYVSPQRPRLLTGIAEARLGAFNASGAADPLGLDDFYDGVRLRGESRLFVQGLGYRGVNLTARLDTRKRFDDPLLKTEDPNREHAIHGDASQMHYAAPAEGGNYVALEKGESFLRYGDFQSPLVQGEFLSYKRTASGLNGALVAGDDAARAFVMKTGRATVRDELPGDGTSGFYYLTRSPVVENSINLVLETRDRYRPERVLAVKPLLQFRDYTVNYFNGAILFKEPIAVTTVEFDPIVVVAIYEVESTAAADYLYGIRGDVGLGRAGGSSTAARRLRLGTTAAARGTDDVEYALYGADGTLTAGPVSLSGEVARSNDNAAGDGNAYKIQAAINNKLTETSISYRRVDGGFQNPSFTGGAHELFTRKAGFDSRSRLSRRWAVESSGYAQRLERTEEEKRSVTALGTYASSWNSLTAGFRAASHERPAQADDALLSILGFGAEKQGRVAFRSQWEKNLGHGGVEDYPDRLKSSATFPVRDRLRLVVTHEYLSAERRDPTHQLLAGMETQPGGATTVYSKYSLNRTASDQRLGAISGIKQRLLLTKRLSGSADIEGFRSFSGSRDDEYVAFKSGLNWLRSGQAMAEGQYEIRWQPVATRSLLRLNAARQLQNGIALLSKNAISWTATDVGPNSVALDAKLAGAYRPTLCPITTMLTLGSHYDRFSPVDPDATTWKFVVATDVNVAPAPAHEVRLKVAYKHVRDSSVGASESSDSKLLLTQYVYNITPVWDVDLWGRVIGQNGEGTRQYGAGLELGRLLARRVRIGAGYSINGFEERDVTANDAWANGFGLRAQFILSEWIPNAPQD